MGQTMPTVGSDNRNLVNITPDDVRRFICPTATEKEIHFFLQLCKAQNLNPFIREVYLIKYGNEAASIVTGKETFLKRAKRNPEYRGHRAWVDGIGEDMVGKAEVYVEGHELPVSIEVDYAEYVGRKKDGDITHMWRTKPKTMLRKVALVQALREAFPDDFGGLYDSAEINTIAHELPSDPINTNDNQAHPKEVEPPIAKAIPVSEAEDTGSPTSYQCSKCWVAVSEKVYEYSQNKYKKLLCYDCQKAHG